MEWYSNFQEKRKKYESLSREKRQLDLRHATIYESIQRVNQGFIYEILNGNVEFPKKVQFSSNKIPFKLDLNKFQGEPEEKESLKHIVDQIEGRTNFYGEKLSFELACIKNQTDEISQILRNGVYNYSEKRVLKKQLENLKERETTILTRVLKNPQAKMHRCHSLKADILIGRYRSQGKIMAPVNLQDLRRRKLSQYSRVKTQLDGPEYKKIKCAFPKEALKMSDEEYVARVKYVLDGKSSFLPTLKQKIPEKRKQEEFFPLKIKLNSARFATKPSETEHNLIFKKVNPEERRIHKSKTKEERIEEGNQMFVAAQKRIKAIDNDEVYNAKRRISTEELSKEKQRNKQGNQYMKDSLLNLKLPIEAFMDTNPIKTEERMQLLLNMKKHRFQELDKKWNEQIEDIIEGRVNKFEGLIKLGNLEKKLITTGDDQQERLRKKTEILQSKGLI